jgi:hypothetical protein
VRILGRVATATPALALVAAAALTAAPADATVARFTVTAKISDHAADTGDIATIQGSVRPARNGSTVLLKQFIHGHWRTIAHTALERRSTYSFFVQPLHPGLKLYRVVKPHEGKIRKGYSPTRRLTAYATHSLTDLRWLPNTAFAKGPATVAGNLYMDAITGLADQSQTVSLAIDLKGQCTSVIGEVGVTQDSSANAVGNIEISAAGRDLFNQTFDPGLGAPLSGSVAGARLLHITVTGVTGSVVAAVGMPIVKCAF